MPIMFFFIRFEVLFQISKWGVGDTNRVLISTHEPRHIQTYMQSEQRLMGHRVYHVISVILLSTNVIIFVRAVHSHSLF